MHENHVLFHACCAYTQIMIPKMSVGVLECAVEQSRGRHRGKPAGL
jgi:hypothetical protein